MARHTALSGGFAFWNIASNSSLKDLATKPSLNGFETRRQDITHIVHPDRDANRSESWVLNGLEELVDEAEQSINQVLANHGPLNPS
ncbi:hypothetical protein BS47DRAFT_1400170 [Hydnum rufescens UP504]|uniref:Uncharacterized protein n=1 Tax=Hydnum rufescens UP504 TaxID=1448309 RepID=A0A9P6AHB2_9AGAM|nr:hypothetical protein BS47DRAFT_1400170 [Hydnum rufescens UP504]